ncbi:YqcI/YcgG family protein [Acrocarpospora sp. B8E8]|uniref:YqcI/YcgG family protein n=1 Tax=Acrocarpospora sp. B8E8 TaxID=3153572 RepID=UPI00325CA370
MIQSVGGYWRPINGLARLLEELGELADGIESRDEGFSHDKLAEEFADIWIISTCTANQFNIDLSSQQAPDGPVPVGVASLLSRAGWIARILNYYDGPKNPRSVADWPSLGAAIATFHVALRRLAEEFKVDVDAAVDAKIEMTPERDVGRFQQSFDPSTAETVDGFERLRLKTPCTLAKRAKLWGAPPWRANWPAFMNVDALVPYLTVFAKAADREGLDGFVVAPPGEIENQGMPGLATWFREFLELLVQNDTPSDRPDALTDINRPGWQFSYHGVRMFISVFSSLYPANHPRHSAVGPYVLFQPESSFDAHGIGSRHPSSARLKQSIRRQFASAGLDYPSEIIDQRVEAAIYLLPRWRGDSEVRWWVRAPESDRRLPLKQS